MIRGMTVLLPNRRTPRTFGVEEEVVLLEPGTLAPVDVADAVIEEIADLDASYGWVGHEFLRAQLEFSSPVLDDAAAADRVVREWRRVLAGAAGRRGLIAASIGTPHGPGVSSVAEGERYERFVAELGAVRPDHSIQGLHVHVGIASREEGVLIMRALRPWLAPLIALTANSPCFAGRDTGFASWRTLVGRRFTTASVPPDFADAADYERRVAALVGLGTTLDSGAIAWMMRLAERYPTVELRVFDAQLSADDTIEAALLTRALVETAAAGALPHDPAAAHAEHLDAAVWHAARHGLDAGLVDPTTASVAPAWDVIERMLEAASPALDAAGDRGRVESLLERTRAAGNGAARQRAALAEGLPALERLLRTSFADSPVVE
ncbi:YbdK family carboxylate-amine ligase [Agrococcus sediminis]|uniref:Putative glutamate--cysteine ligase 2 n=2 Tax=Agrococcus sediminis TaxID=2599924 RepID=A0A5M8QPX1_9MICO|nr:YbdK family carboxylate-amine ligase [Agrococcus sediminis]